MSRGNFPGEIQSQVVTFPIAVYVLGVSSRVANIHVFLQKWDVVRDCMRPASAAAVVGFLSGQVALQLHALRPLRGGARLPHSGEKTRPSTWWPKIGLHLQSDW